jgi:hypothetical protein
MEVYIIRNYACLSAVYYTNYNIFRLCSGYIYFKCYIIYKLHICCGELLLFFFYDSEMAYYIMKVSKPAICNMEWFFQHVALVTAVFAVHNKVSVRNV